MMATASRISAASSTVLVCCLISSSIFVVPVATAALDEAQKEEITFLHGDALKKGEDGLAAQPVTQEDQHVTGKAFLSQASDGTSALSTAKIGAGLSLFLFCICCACVIGIPAAVLYFVYNSFPGNNEQQLAVQPSQGFPQPVVSQRTDEVEMTMDRLPVVTGVAAAPEPAWRADIIADANAAVDRAQSMRAEPHSAEKALNEARAEMDDFRSKVGLMGNAGMNVDVKVNGVAGVAAAPEPAWRADIMAEPHSAEKMPNEARAEMDDFRKKAGMNVDVRVDGHPTFAGVAAAPAPAWHADAMANAQSAAAQSLLGRALDAAPGLLMQGMVNAAREDMEEDLHRKANMKVEVKVDGYPIVAGAAHGPTGWWADAMCDGTRAADRAEWLQANEGLSMWAAQQRVMNEFPQVFTVGGGASGADAPGWRGDVMCDGHTAADRARFLQTNNGMSAIDAQLKIMAEFPQIFGACIKCKGNGFVHESNMEHKEAPNTKCFFCKECPSCKGTGRAQGPPCIPCKGRGWKHSSGMEHKGAEDAKCFFCDTCQVCQGKGHKLMSDAALDI